MALKKIELEVLATMGLEELKGLKLEELTKTDQKKVTKRISKLEEEMKAPEKAPEKAPKKAKQTKATIITNEEEKALEEKKEALRKFKYNTAGTQWELLPNLLDTKMNTHNKEMIDILNTLPNRYNQSEQDNLKGNGEIIIHKLKTPNNEANQYLISLEAHKDLTFNIFLGITYPYQKTNKEGIDNRTYTYKGIQEITIPKGHIFQLGQTTNPGKARDYSKKWAQYLKVQFDKPQFDKPTHLPTYEVRPDNTLDMIGKNSGEIQKTGIKWEEIYKNDTIIDNTQYIIQE
jgi:hypothetical protein